MSLAVRNGSMASLYALRGQVSWSLRWRMPTAGRCCHGRGPAGGWLGAIIVLCCSGRESSMSVQEGGETMNTRGGR
jgi:hypothetical protein